MLIYKYFSQSDYSATHNSVGLLKIILQDFSAKLHM